MKGSVTFYWEDGYKLKLSILSHLMGLKHNNKRPIYYKIEIEGEALQDIILNRWFSELPLVLDRRITERRKNGIL